MIRYQRLQLLFCCLLLTLLTGLVSSCSPDESPREAIRAAIEQREKAKGRQIVTWLETGQREEYGWLQVSYSAIVRAKSGNREVHDTVWLTRTGDGILLVRPVLGGIPAGIDNAE